MSRARLLSSCGAAALLAVSAGAAFGQSISVGDVTQTTDNSGLVTNLGTVSVSEISGDGSSASVSATGAASAVSLQSINGTATGGGHLKIGNVTQNTTNLGEVVNTGDIVGAVKGVSGNGASASVSATGAQSAAGSSRIGGSDAATETAVGSGDQNTTNRGNVTNTGTVLNTASGLSEGLSGNGSSVSVNATGASTTISASSINTGGADTISIAPLGTAAQTTLNDSEFVVNYAYLPGSAMGELAGHGSSASVSATGAASSVAVSRIASAPLAMATIGNINQHTTNNADVTNKHSGQLFGTLPFTGTMTLADLSGDGTSASISATGAASAVSYSSIVQDKAASNSITMGDVTQYASNTGGIINTGPVEKTSSTSGPSTFVTDVFKAAALRVGDLTGAGSSATVSVTGAASSISVSKISDASATDTSIGNVDQETSNSGKVANYGDIKAGNLVGNAAAVSISATGAVSSVSYSNINSGSETDSFSGGNIVQSTENSGDVANAGGGKLEQVFVGGSSISDVYTYDTAFITVGDLSGAATSASISASGAVTAASASAIGGAGSTTVKTTSITQSATNSGEILNPGNIKAGNLEGAGTSVSVTAIGAASSVAVSKIANAGSMTTDLGPITSDSLNSGTVKNRGTINAGVLSGNGSSVSIGATGAASQASMTRINGGPIIAVNSSITQGAINHGPVTNEGTITVGNLTGNNASASISAAGAVSQVSFTSICGGCSSSFTSGAITQTSLNSASVTNTGAITAGGLTGPGTSASVSALGAGSVVSGSITSY